MEGYKYWSVSSLGFSTFSIPIDANYKDLRSGYKLEFSKLDGPCLPMIVQSLVRGKIPKFPFSLVPGVEKILITIKRTSLKKLNFTVKL